MARKAAIPPAPPPAPPAPAETAPGVPVARAPDLDGESPIGAGQGVLLEVAWEVCNQVGGIYQVIRSKAAFMTERWGDRYFLVGPYEGSKAAVEFEPLRPTGWVGRAIAQLQAQGLTVHHGHWLIEGRPRVLLIDRGPIHGYLHEVKARLWRDHAIETHAADGLTNDVIAFGEGVRRLVEALAEQQGLSGPTRSAAKPMVVHLHEWMGGLAIPMIRRQALPVALVFTTHATQLGRFIAMNDASFYDRLPWLDHDREATRYNVRTQHGIERACAHGAHVFTTVSSITAEECLHLLGRVVDVILPNGLNIHRYNATHDQQRLHAEAKESIHRFVMGYFFPSYSFDLEQTLYFFTSGRFEPRNKGFDLCLDAMARLNAELKAAAIPRTVVFFIVTRRPVKSINPLTMEMRGVLNELREICQQITEGVGERLFQRAAAGGKLQLDNLVDEYWKLRYRRAQHAMQQHCLPMVVSHILEDDQNDPVLNHIRALGLINRPDDPVKVVYHPDFITPHNRLWGIEYDQFVRGCHLGLFPSAYEPWGYTPLECAAMGVPSVTSDLAGFGRYTREHVPDHDKAGIIVLPRRGRAFHESAADLTRRLLEYCRLDRRGRIALRNEVDRRSWDFDWSLLGRAYHAAHALALERLAVKPVG